MRRILQLQYLRRLFGVFILYTASIYLFYYFASTSPNRLESWLPLASLVSVVSFVLIIALVNFGPLLFTTSRLAQKAQQAAQHGDHPLAAQYYNEALQHKPGHADYLYGRGQARAMQGDRAGALADYTAAIEATPLFIPSSPSIAYDAYLARANAYADNNDYARAAQEATGAVKMYPLREDAYLYRALCYRVLGRYDLAYADLSQVVGFNPQSPIAYNNRGYLSYLAGSYPLAAADLQKAITLAPGLWQAHYHLAQVQAALGQNWQAVASLRQAGSLNRQPLVQAQADAAFAPLQVMTEFQRLVGGYTGPGLRPPPPTEQPQA